MALQSLLQAAALVGATVGAPVGVTARGPVAGAQWAAHAIECPQGGEATPERGQDLSRHLRAGLERLRDAALDPEGPLYPRAAEGPAER